MVSEPTAKGEGGISAGDSENLRERIARVLWDFDPPFGESLAWDGANDGGSGARNYCRRQADAVLGATGLVPCPTRQVDKDGVAVWSCPSVAGHLGPCVTIQDRVFSAATPCLRFDSTPEDGRQQEWPTLAEAVENGDDWTARSGSKGPTP